MCLVQKLQKSNLISLFTADELLPINDLPKILDTVKLGKMILRVNYKVFLNSIFITI